MRIISGKHKGRVIYSPKKFSTHPMSEKMRGALFNSFGSIEGLRVLDAYAGSGAIGLEALSRGARLVVACDRDRTAVATIKHNVASLGVEDKIIVAHANCVSYLANQAYQFDVVICDPPYNDVKVSQLQRLTDYVLDDGLFIVSLPPDFTALHFDRFDLINTKSYGDAALWYYRKQ